MEIETASALTGHPLESSERVIGQFMIVVSGFPHDGMEAASDAAKKMLIKSVLDNRGELGKLVANLHVTVEDFNPRKYFGDSDE
jgi:hypothetical protein